MKVLNEQDVIRIFDEEWTERVRTFVESSEAKIEKTDISKNLLTKNLELKHRASGLQYTIAQVNDNDVILVTPEGEEMLVSHDEIADDYLVK